MRKFLLSTGLIFIGSLICCAQLVYLHPDQVDDLQIIGSDNVVIRGETVKVKPKSIVRKVRQGIEEKFQKQIDSLNLLLTQSEVEAAAHQGQLDVVKRQKEEAIKAAFLLTDEFKTLDFQREAAVYQLLDSLFKAGNIEGCLALLSTEIMEAEDEKNARNRRIKARLHAVNFEFTKAEQNFLKASRIYPSFENHQSVINFYLSTDKLNDFKTALDNGKAYAKTIDEQLFIEGGYLHLLQVTGNKVAALEMMEACDKLVQKSKRTDLEKKSYTAAKLISMGEQYGSMPGKRSLALNYAKEGMYHYKELVEVDEKMADGYIAALHILGKINWLHLQFENAVEWENKALAKSNEYRPVLGEEIYFRLQYLDIILMMASIQADRNNSQVAEQFLEEALDTLDGMYRSTPSLAILSRQASAQYNLGNLRLSIRKYDLAITTYDKAEERFQQLLEVDSSGMNKFDFLGKVYNNRGKCYERLRQTDHAIANYKKAHFYFTHRQTPEGKTLFDDNSFNAIMNLADNYYLLADYTNAAIHYKKSLFQMSYLYGTEPRYWQNTYVSHILQAGKSHLEVFRMENDPAEFMEGHRHFQSAADLIQRYPESSFKDSMAAQITASKIALLDLALVFYEKSSLSEEAFLDRLTLEKELALTKDLNLMTDAYQSFSNLAIEAVLKSTKDSPFNAHNLEHENEINKRAYAWWSENLALCYSLQRKFDKAAFAAKSAESYFDNDQNKIILAVILLLNNEKKEALNTLKKVGQTKDDKIRILKKCLARLENKGVVELTELKLDKFYSKIK